MSGFFQDIEGETGERQYAKSSIQTLVTSSFPTVDLMETTGVSHA